VKARARTRLAREPRATRWHLVWLLKARPIVAMASAVSGMRVVYDKEGVDPGQCPEHHTPHFHPRRRRPRGSRSKDRGHNRTGEDASPERSDRNADAHLKRQIMGREVVVAVTNGYLDIGTWERIFYGEFDGRRRKRVLVKIIGK
jgi:hypothetical protein